MNYYWFNREEVLQKAKEKYNNCGGKEKSAEYYGTNKEIKKNCKFVLCSIKVSQQTLRFAEIVVNKNGFHASKEAIFFKFSRKQ